MQTPVAAFDFDGTLIDRDSLLPFLIYRNGYLQVYLNLFFLLPFFLAFLFKIISRQAVKEKILTRFLKGCKMGELQDTGKRYAAEILDTFIRPDVLKKLKLHQKEGHRCIIISASPNIYLEAWAERYGVRRVLSSELELSPDGIVTGRLKGQNCRGDEKVRRLLEELGPKQNYYLYAYGDSRGDKELLALADCPTRV